MDTGQEMFAQLVRHYRTQVGSKSECARLLGYSVGSLSRIEAGQRVPRVDTAADLDAAFGAGGAIEKAARVLRAGSREATSLDTDDSAEPLDGEETGQVERRELFQHALKLTGAAGLAGTFGHLDAVRATLDDALDRSVEEWQEVAFDYGRDILTLPPADLVDDLARDVLAVRRLLDRPGSAGDRASLQRVAGQLAAVMAMTLGNLGQLAHARRWWRTAVTAAERSGDAEMVTWVCARQAVRALYERTPDEATAIAGRALAHAPHEVGAGVMGALTARAHAFARRGDPEAYRVADHAADAFEQLPLAVTADRTTIYGWSEERLRMVQTYVYAHTGDHRAPSACDATLELYPEGLYGPPTQVRLYHAGWLARTGDPAEGLRQAIHTVNSLPLLYRDYPIMAAARDVERALPAGADSTTEAADYRELLAAST